MLDLPPPPELSALLADLTPAQQRAVTSDAAPLCIVAAAGAGKTRVLTRRIAYRTHAGAADARHVLALTFTRKAAGELGERLAQLGVRDQVTAGTFHAVAAAQLRRWWADRGQSPLTLLDRKARILGPLIGARPGLAGVPVAELAGHLEWAKARLIRPEDFEPAAAAARRPMVAPAADVAALYQRYEHEKARRGLVDFDDLLSRCADALERDSAFAGAQRWRWRHIFVDEFQDINPLQDRLLRAWLGPSLDLCVVGDPNQAIYGWNGADPHLLDAFATRWPTADVVRLDDNHRCSPQIVAAAGAVLASAAAPGAPRSSRPDGPTPEVRAYPSEIAEAHGIAGQLRAAHHQGRPWSHLAVLVRTNAQIAAFRSALDAAGVPYRAPGVAALLQHPSARLVLDELRRASDRPLQMVAADLAADAAAAAEAEGTPSSGSGSDLERAGVLSALAGLAQDYRRLVDHEGVAGFLSWLPSVLGREAESAAPADAVTVCSFHRAKGLEWPVVWVAGLDAGLCPIGHASTPEEVDEERRVLYVALTRAGDELRCSWAETRSFGSRPLRRDESPWLAPIRAAGRQDPGVPATGVSVDEWRSRLRADRDRLRQRGQDRQARAGFGPGDAWGARGAGTNPPWPEPDPALIERLETWRRNAARASGVPARVLLHDTTLRALAALRPATEAELLEVPGLGPVKAGRFGGRLLAVLTDQPASA